MYSLPIVRAIHFWHFFTEAVGIMLSCLVHSCLVQLGKNGSFVKEGIWRCFEVKNINCVWHFPLHVVAVCRWMAGQPKPLSCYPAGCLCVQLLLWLFTVSLSGRGLFTTFPVGHSFWRPRRLNCYKRQQFVCQSGCSLDWAAMETKGSETMQQIT